MTDKPDAQPCYRCEMCGEWFDEPLPGGHMVPRQNVITREPYPEQCGPVTLADVPKGGPDETIERLTNRPKGWSNAQPTPRTDDAEIAIALNEIQEWFNEGYGPTLIEQCIGRQFLRMKRALAQKDAELEHALKRDEVNDLKKANKILSDELESMNRSLEGEIEAREEAERKLRQTIEVDFPARIDKVTATFRQRAEAAEQHLVAVQAQLAGVVEQFMECLGTELREQGFADYDVATIRCNLTAAIRALSPVAVKGEAVYVIFDGPPSHESGRFIEVETADGKSVNVAEWTQDGAYWKLGPLYAAPQDAQAEAEPVARVTYSNWNGMNVEPLPSYPAILPVGTLLYAARAGKQERTR